MPTDTKSGATPDRILRCGVVGVGRMGRHHARVYSELPGVELVGVVDASIERAESIAETRNCRAFATEQELLEAGVDAVSIAVPTTAHMKSASTGATAAALAFTRWPSWRSVSIATIG